MMAIVVLVVGVVVTGWLSFRGSLPVLDGACKIAGLKTGVRIERDGNGVPTIHAATREDAARALGFLHAQDRFFQMDLLRRQAAGELAELFGPVALPMDKEIRIHQFGARSTGMLARFDPAEICVLDAYTAGVNAGLARLSVRPWKYLVPRTSPRPWRREDSLFVVEAMAIALQEHDGLGERMRQAIQETYGEEALAFLRPTMTEHSAALDGSSPPPAAHPERRCDPAQPLPGDNNLPRVQGAASAHPSGWTCPQGGRGKRCFISRVEPANIRFHRSTGRDTTTGQQVGRRHFCREPPSTG